MDYFAGRRFGEDAFDAGQSVHQPKRFAGRDHSLLSSSFDHLMPAIARWVADDRGRLLELDGGSSEFGRLLLSAVAAGGWRRLFGPDDLPRIRAATTLCGTPPPLAVTCILAGEPRRALIRMAAHRDARGNRRWFGTIEDIHDQATEEVRQLRIALVESEQHHRSFVDLSPQVPWTATPSGHVEEIGARWETLTGSSRESAMRAGWVDAMHPDDRAAALRVWAERLKSGVSIDVRYRVRVPDEGYRWMRARAQPRLDAHGAIIRWYGTLEDVHEIVVAEQARADSEERFRLAIQSVRIGIWDHDLIAGVGVWSDELRTMLGLPEDGAAKADYMTALVHPDDRGMLQDMIVAAANEQLPPRFETTVRVHRADTGEMRWIRSTGWAKRAGPDEAHAGRVTRVIVTVRDVTAERDGEERIRWTATHDPLTQLPNRALWQATLDDMVDGATASGNSFGLLLLDMDELKRTNDTLGHDAGDALLRNFSERLLAAAPDDAMVGRLGGDEFGLIAASLADSEALQQCSARILAALRRPHMFEGHLLECGASIGGAVFGLHGDTAPDLFKAADLALYASKGTGRGRLTLFDPSLKKDAEQRSAMIHLAREAVEHGRILPYYQPRIDMRTGEVLGCEALLRWQDPERGIQLPGTIAAAFRHPEIAVTLTQTMLAAVTRDIRAWLDVGINPGRVAINASAADFMRGNFADYVLDALSRAGVPTSNFEVEVTETVFLGRGASHVEHALAQFAQAGVRIALDDFGTGYASLSHLKQYPVDVLKIDRSFVRNLEQDRGDEAIVDAIVKLGSSLRIEVIAEGVETEGQRDILLSHGCTLGQGFLLGHPQPHASLSF